jgi:hypothetical protein
MLVFFTDIRTSYHQNASQLLYLSAKYSFYYDITWAASKVGQSITKNLLLICQYIHGAILNRKCNVREFEAAVVRRHVLKLPDILTVAVLEMNIVSFVRVKCGNNTGKERRV